MTLFPIPKLLLTGALLIISFYAYPQTDRIDSLKKELSKNLSDRQQIDLLFALCSQSSSLHPDTLIRYTVKAEQLANISKNVNDIATVEYYKAWYLNKRGFTDSALSIITKNIANLKESENQSVLTKFQIFKSNILIRNNQQKEAIENCLQVLHKAESANDLASQLKSKTIIGWAYMELAQNNDALKWLQEAIEIFRISGEQIPCAVTFCNIAATYNEVNKNDSAEFYIKKAILLAKKEQDLTSLTNGYYIYSDILVDLGDNDKAGSLLKEGLSIRKQIGDVFYIVSDIMQLGIFYANNKEPQKGIAILKEGIDIAEKNHLDSKLPVLYSALAENYKVAGNLKDYSTTLSRIITLKDSLYLRNKAEALADLEKKYELQKKENIIITQRFDISRKNYLIAGSLLLLVATLLAGYSILQNRKKNQRLKLQSLELEQKKVMAQAILQAEEIERKRIASDLHDSVAQKLVVAKLNLATLENQLLSLPNNQQLIINNINTLLEESATEVRNLSHSMMPQSFSQSGLAESIKELLDKIKLEGLHISFSTEGDFSTIDENRALMTYRIMQETIQNTLKHAKAKRLDVSIISEDNELAITIEDDGIGFSSKTVVEKASSGLRNIQSRVEYLNGTMEITSQPDKGTVSVFYIPTQNKTN